MFSFGPKNKKILETIGQGSKKSLRAPGRDAIGYIRGGRIFDARGDKIGRVDPSGWVFDSNEKHVGTVQSVGGHFAVHGQDSRKVGHSETRESAAALLLLRDKLSNNGKQADKKLSSREGAPAKKREPARYKPLEMSGTDKVVKTGGPVESKPQLHLSPPPKL